MSQDTNLSNSAAVQMKNMEHISSYQSPKGTKFAKNFNINSSGSP